MKLFAAAIVLVILFPFFLLGRRFMTGKRMRWTILFNILTFFTLCTVFVLMVSTGTVSVAAAETAAETTEAATVDGFAQGMRYLAAALSTGMACIGAGIAVAAGASAAIGATSEDSKMLGKALIFVALGEGVSLFGLLVSILILG